MDELKKAIAFIFQTKSRQVLKETEFTLTASMTLRWFSPNDAEKLLKSALLSGLLTRTAEGVTTGFDYKSVEVPLGFKPDKSVLEYKQPRGFFERVLERIEETRNLERKKIVAEINREHERLVKAVDIEVTALIVARKHGIDVSDLLEEAEKRYKKGEAK